MTFTTTWKGAISHSSEFLQNVEALGDLRLACRLPCLSSHCQRTPLHGLSGLWAQAPFPPLQAATRVPFGARMAYGGGTLSPQEDGFRKEACADPGSGCGASEAGILGSWDPGKEYGVWPLGVHSSLALQTVYPMGWGIAGGASEWASEGEAPPCQGPGATLGPSAQLLCWRRHAGRWEICVTGGNRPRFHSVSQWLLPFLQASHLSSEQHAVISHFCEVQ